MGCVFSKDKMIKATEKENFEIRCIPHTKKAIILQLPGDVGRRRHGIISLLIISFL